MTEPTPDELPEEDFTTLIDALEGQVFAQRVDEAVEVCRWLADAITSRQHQDLDLVLALKLTSKRLTRFKNTHL